jgi:hypothetical protein
VELLAMDNFGDIFSYLLNIPAAKLVPDEIISLASQIPIEHLPAGTKITNLRHT